MQKDHKFTWGDSVLIKKDAPKKFHPGECASICGIIEVNSEILAKEYQSNINDWVYTIEFVGGKDMEIPERYLEPYHE